jgi:DNA-binding transcriptional ArsR family regulator
MKNMAPCCVLCTPLSEAQSQALAKLMKALSVPVRVRLLSLVAKAP